jgi:hypothetical protein
MNVLGAVVPHLFEVVALEDVQHEEFGGTLRRGRVLVDLVTAVTRRDWRFDLGRVAREILVAIEAAVLLGEVGHRPGDVALVEAIACGAQRLSPTLPRRGLFRVDQLTEHACRVRIPEQLAWLRRSAVGEVDLHRGRILPDLL